MSPLSTQTRPNVHDDRSLSTCKLIQGKPIEVLSVLVLLWTSSPTSGRGRLRSLDVRVVTAGSSVSTRKFGGTENFRQETVEG